MFGVFSEFEKGAAIPVGLASSVKKGKATVRVMLNEGKAEDYEIEITEICNKSPNKCFTVRVTDSRLLEKTGGIVQGMSGSPIIQDGKLVGAVTHVILLANIAVCTAALCAMLRKRSVRGAICARSLVQAQTRFA